MDRSEQVSFAKRSEGTFCEIFFQAKGFVMINT